MKFPQSRIIAILLAIPALVFLFGLLVLTTENALADGLANQCWPIPKPTLKYGYKIPVNPSYTSPCDSVRISDFAWHTFVALNWPADSKGKPLSTIGSAPKNKRVWEYYEFPEDVFNAEEKNGKELNQTLRLAKSGSKFGSKFGLNQSRIRKLGLNQTIAESENSGDISILELGEKALVDSSGNYILNEIRMNPVEVNQIVSNSWNSVEGLMSFENNSSEPFQLMCSAKSPGGIYSNDNSNNIPCLVKEGNDDEGTIEIKAAWMVLPDRNTSLPGDTPLLDPTQYYTTTRVLYVKTPENYKRHEGAITRVEVPVALVGFHILQKTSQVGWIWATFDHINNAPNDKDRPTGKHYNLYYCPKNDCEINTPLATGPYLWQLDFPHAVTEKNGKIEAQTPSQITRLVPIQDTAQLLNEKWEYTLPSFWKNYRLTGVQWLQNP